MRGACLLQLAHESCMLRGGEPLLEDLEDSRNLKVNHCRGIEQHAREALAVQHATSIRLHGLELTMLKHEPVDGLIEDTPDDVLTDAVAQISLQLGVQV